MIVLDAVDVAMTEASVGAGVSTVLLLAHAVSDQDAGDARPSALDPCRVFVAPWSAASWSGGRSGCRRSALPTRRSTARRAATTCSRFRPGNDSAERRHRRPGDYRGFDTLGETTVIFTAGIGVMLLLRGRASGATGQRRQTTEADSMKLDLILRVATKIILPFILLFALYVQFHGDYGPGGGFQAGVIAAGMVILYAIIFGARRRQARRRRRAGGDSWCRSAC